MCLQGKLFSIPKFMLKVLFRSVVGYALFELAKSASSQLHPYYKELVPIIFLARHEADKQTKKLFDDTWGL